ncbi:ribonuclease [Sphingomonas sp. CL5.1]|uniref:ribonuclease n=1 Tax=Sphingomonas sp. CL5.1 TaxID=2653203 RepID=UPI0015830C25|nr:ribonuclease [Sphingomonas sp. CL5.1]QKR99198.1 ribonuclease [Sphingomonas sp. CL5.1]
MAEWLFEDGIGEARAALVAEGRILRARIVPDGAGPALGAIYAAQLIEPGVVRLPDGSPATLLRPPAGLTLGARLNVEVVREALPETGRRKPPRVIATDAAPRAAPSLRDTLDGPVRVLRAHEADALEEAGWSEVIEEALTGDIVFPGGALRMTPTPAMTLFDVDGDGPLDALAERAAAAVAAAIVRHDVGGSIGVDFPTIQGKEARQRVAAALDAELPQPFERTAMNGFGFLQIVRPRPRASLPELLRADPVGAAARAALRQIERTPPGAPGGHRLAPAVRARIEARADWLAELVRRTGRTPILQ